MAEFRSLALGVFSAVQRRGYAGAYQQLLDSALSTVDQSLAPTPGRYARTIATFQRARRDVAKMALIDARQVVHDGLRDQHVREFLERAQDEVGVFAQTVPTTPRMTEADLFPEAERLQLERIAAVPDLDVVLMGKRPYLAWVKPLGRAWTERADAGVFPGANRLQIAERPAPTAFDVKIAFQRRHG